MAPSPKSIKQLALIAACCIIASIPVKVATQINAIDLVQKSIEYHDPEGILATNNVRMNFIETRPNGPDRQSNVTINIPKETYLINREVEEHKVSMKWQKNKSSYKLDGKSKLTAAQIEKYNLNDERLHKMKDYYRYLWHLPMTLQDPGTIIDDHVKKVEFNNKESLELKVSYDPNVGADIWYFYFDPSSYALVGYRFYHDQSANDGEYILLTEEFQSGKLRLPKKRAWYMHKDDKYLGEDILNSVSID